MTMHIRRMFLPDGMKNANQARTINPAILGRYSQEMEKKMNGLETSWMGNRAKKIATGTSILAVPVAIKFWHEAVLYSTYDLFLPGSPIGNIVSSVFGEKNREAAWKLADNNFGSMEDVLTFGWPILAAVTLGGVAAKLLKGANGFKHGLAEKLHSKRTEITVAVIASVGVLSEIFPIFTKGGFVTELTNLAYGALSRVLPMEWITTAFEVNVRDALDIPFVVFGGIAAYAIFKPMQHFLDVLAADKMRK